MLRPMRRPSSVAASPRRWSWGSTVMASAPAMPAAKQATVERSAFTHGSYAVIIARDVTAWIGDVGAGGADLLGDAGPQPADGAERGDRGELVGGRGEAQLDAGDGVGGRDARARRAPGGTRCRRRSWRRAAGRRTPPASWKRVPSTVTTRRSGRSAPSVVIQVAMASRSVGERRSRPGRRRRRRAGRRRASRTAGWSPIGVGGLPPAGAGVEHDAGEVEQHAVEHAGDRRGVDRRQAGEVEEHGRRALLQLGRRRGGAGGGVDALADVPAVVAGCRRPCGPARTVRGRGTRRRPAAARRPPCTAARS